MYSWDHYVPVFTGRFAGVVTEVREAVRDKFCKRVFELEALMLTVSCIAPIAGRRGQVNAL